MAKPSEFEWEEPDDFDEEECPDDDDFEVDEPYYPGDENPLWERE